MNDKYLKSISAKIYHQFPEVDRSKPKVRRQSGQQVKSKSGTPTYLITYCGIAKTPDGKSLTRIVRVTADDCGKIIKITTSR